MEAEHKLDFGWDQRAAADRRAMAWVVMARLLWW
jgi:hypothetical protein